MSRRPLTFALPALRRPLVAALPALLLLATAPGCRDTKSRQPPVHLQQNMDFNQVYTAQEASGFWPDQRSNRLPVEGTVARAATFAGGTVPLADDDPHLAADSHLYRGRGADGRLVDALPPQITLTQALLDRGHARYDIYCAPCHGVTGVGDGAVAGRGLKVPPPTYHSPRLRAMPLGHFFDVITRGRATMFSYAAQIPVEDRWAIAAWVRTLQVSHSARLADVPASERKPEWGTP